MTDPPPRRRRRGLATRIAVLSVGIAVLTAIIAGILAVGLIRNNGARAAQRTFSRLADVTQSVVGNNRAGTVSLNKLNTALKGLGVQSGKIGPTGLLATRGQLVRAAIRPQDIAAVRAGRKETISRSVNGVTVFVGLRATPDGGGIVIVQKQADATAQDDRAIRRIIVALLIAGTLAAFIGLFVAWRLARPLRRTAAAARSLAKGNRDVTLPAEGPQEVVEVSDAINSLAAALRHSEQRQRSSCCPSRTTCARR